MGRNVDKDNHLYACEACGGNFIGHNVVGMEADRNMIMQDMLFYGQRVDMIRMEKGWRTLVNVSTENGINAGDETVHCPICHAVHYAGFTRAERSSEDA